ncbi:MAG: PPOX class F420-dependent oxidoreductase, partial [Anaerolineales bacterium]|nr:PPOX class F420-dependent oxidoreductase [Anaerolineales bacterium]
DTHLDLLADETRSFAFLATTMDDGSPQVTPIWFNTDGDDILINSAQGRVKDRNMRARPQIALAIVDPKNPYRYMQIRGRVVEMNTENGWAHIDTLAKKYTGSDHFTPNSNDEIRVVYRVRLERVHVTG